MHFLVATMWFGNSLDLIGISFIRIYLLKFYFIRLHKPRGGIFSSHGPELSASAILGKTENKLQQTYFPLQIFPLTTKCCGKFKFLGSYTLLGIKNRILKHEKNNWVLPLEETQQSASKTIQRTVQIFCDIPYFL